MAIALLLGGLLTFAYAPFDQWWLTWLSLVGFIILLAKSPAQQAFKLGFAFGLGWFGAGISWVHVSIADYGGLPLIGSVGLMLVLCSYLALYPACVFYTLKKYFAVKLWPLALPLLWLVAEALRGWLLTGFPWLSLGYSQLFSPLAGWFAVIGEFGVSALLILGCAALACSFIQRQWLSGILIVSVLGLSGVVLNQVNWVKPTQQQVNIAMVQGNIQQALRWVPEQDLPTMQTYQALTAAHWGADIFIWPEAAVPKLEPLALDYLADLDQQMAQHQAGLITGIVNYNFENQQAFNNLLALGLKEATQLQDDNTAPAQGQYHYFHANRYAKHHLLPIGEFIPFEDWIRGLAPIFDLPMSSFSRGDYQQANLQAKGWYFAPAICFEIAFPAQIAANLHQHTNFIITVSNDAWFGHSHGPAQHLQIAQTRAKEFGLPVLRATNNGITAFIDHQGNIQSRLPQFEAAVLRDNIAIVEGYTPYRQWADLPIWLLSLLSFIVGIRLRNKQI
jgi:apolipoprotein N-acyltransferase